MVAQKFISVTEVKLSMLARTRCWIGLNDLPVTRLVVGATSSKMFRRFRRPIQCGIHESNKGSHGFLQLSKADSNILDVVHVLFYPGATYAKHHDWQF